MLEQEQNKYFEQAREATLAEIGSNQQAMLDNAMAAQETNETLEPAYVVDDGPVRNQLQGQIVAPAGGGLVQRPVAQPQTAAEPAASFQSPINPNLVADEAQKYPAVDASRLNVGAPQSAQQPFQNPINPNLVAEAAQQQPGVYVGHGMTMPAGLAVQANEAAARASQTPFDDIVMETEAEKAAREKQAMLEKALDPQAMRAESSRKWIAGIGDALASVANMVGTGHGAANQQQTYALPSVNAAIEADRKRRGEQYQRQLDRINALEIQESKNKAAEAERAYKKEKDEADRAFNREKWEAETEHKKNQLQRQIDQDQFNNELNTRKQEENERHNKSQESINWYKATKGENPNGTGDDGGNGSSSRFSGKRGGGIKEAKTDYNSMLDEIAENNGCENWADLTNRAKSDRALREIHNKFDLGKDKAGAAKIEGMISSYAKNYAPEFYEHYFGKSAGDGNVDFNAYKTTGAGATAAPSGGSTLSGIMSSTPQAGGKKRRRKQ